jgi:dUTP pyrophosphatase
VTVGEEIIRVKRLRANARVPERATEGSTGHDLYACLDAPLEVGPEPVKVPAGIAIEAPPGFDVQVRPRSGLSSKGIMVAFGTVDSDYRGELLVTMFALPHRQPHVVHDGDRIAQMVISRSEHPRLEIVEELSATTRDTGGHGSTGR